MALRKGSRFGAASRSRGFTLVELMVVVLIVGVLAAIGVAAVRSHAFASRSSEALAMIQSIRAAQERYRAENLVYLDVSSSWYPVKPEGEHARQKRDFFGGGEGHTDAAAWRLLNPTVPGPVAFAYMVHAGAPSESMSEPSSDAPSGIDPGWPDPPGKHWYVIEALGNADGDSKFSYFLAGSLRADVYRANEGE